MLNGHLVLSAAKAQVLPSFLPTWLSAASPAPGTAWAPAHRLCPPQASPPDPAALAPWPHGASTPSPADSQSPWVPLASPLPRVTPGQPASFPDSPPAAISTHGPRVPLLSPSFFRRAHLTMAHRVSCDSFPCPVPSHTNTWGVHQQGDWLEPLPAAAPPKPSLPPASHPSPICFSLTPRTGGVAPEDSRPQPTSTRHPSPRFTSSNDRRQHEWHAY